MKNIQYKNNYKIFLRKFLSPSETNRNKLLDLIRDAFQVFPLPIKDKNPYLGNNYAGYSFAKEYENIPLKPQNEKKVIQAAARFLSGSIRWHSPVVLQNVTPPPLLESVAISAIVNLYNLNMLWDYVSAGTQEAEHQIVRQMASLAEWNTDKADGVFTYGGKGCLTYAIRIGLNRCMQEVASKGVANRNPVIITTDFNHYIIEAVCAFLGLGTKACVRVKTDSNEVIDLNDFERVLSQMAAQKRPIATIILSGGSTINLNIDPVDEVVKIVDKIQKKYKLTYRPFIYFDTVLAWPWLFFKDYDFKKNSLNIALSSLEKIKIAAKRLSKISFADGFGVDFHKIGFAPYSNSAFFVKNGSDLHSLIKDQPFTYKRNKFGSNFLQFHTIEHSRSAAPVLAAWVILQSVGVEGFQMYLARMHDVGDIFRDILPKYGFELVNPYSICYASVYYPVPPKGPKNYKELVEATPEQIEQCTQYTYKLSSYLGKGIDDDEALDVGFLRSYLKSNCGMTHSVLRIYPMSPYLDVDQATKLAHLIGRKKQKFDFQYSHEKIEVPNVVHK